MLVATLTRDLGDLGLAEEAAQDAFAEAAARWGPDNTPDRPGAWLLTTARRKAIDQIRRNKRFDERLPALLELSSRAPPEESELIDDQLALIFGCCHSSLNPESRIALTLRQVCGLSTAQIADAFLVTTATMAKRLTRAKGKIRKANVPFVVPDSEHLPERLAEVLHVIYLIFTAGHTNTEGPGLVRGDLCDEARWLAEVIDRLLSNRAGEDRPTMTPNRAEVLGLSALMLFTDARRAARIDDEGHLVLLEDQNRRLWDRAMVAEGQSALARAQVAGHVGPYQLQAAIAGLHATAPRWDDTDWAAIVALYGRLAHLTPNPVIELNRAVAISMADGPQAGLAAIDELTGSELDGYRYLHAARADMLRRLGRGDDAVDAYRRALALGGNSAEQEFLIGRLRELGAEPE